MRTQPTKTQPKKGALLKTSFKQHAPTKQVKKKQCPNTSTVKSTVKKPVVKITKKKKVQKTNEDSTDDSEDKFKAEGKAETSKSLVSIRSKNPAKKNILEKEKKFVNKKAASQLTKNKKIKQNAKIIKSNSTSEDNESDSGDEIKYKINSEHIKQKQSKGTKSKVASKTSTALSPKKHSTSPKNVNIEENSCNTETKKKEEISLSVLEKPDKPEINLLSTEGKTSSDTKSSEGLKKPAISDVVSNIASRDAAALMLQKPKTENERPPKFFTSTRSPRVVDIDLKSCKTTKTNLSMSDKSSYVKTPDNKNSSAVESKDGESSGFVSKESEIDVYTFTDYKVDSPKSILSDFRGPIGKNVGRVRPIARVKGTVINKSKGEMEKKKYSPHRPIEEVVKQLKAGKRAEEARLLLAFSDDILEHNKSITASSSIGGETNATKEFSEANSENIPKSVVSKSYKMVARKSNIPGTTASTIICPSVDIERPPTDNVSGKTYTISLNKSKHKKTSKMRVKNKNTLKNRISDEDIDHSTFSLNTSSTSHAYSSSDESESNYDTKESSDSENSQHKKFESNRRKGRKICDSERKSTSKDLGALSPDSLIDLKESSSLIGDDRPSKRRLKLLSMWTGPKKHRMASLNALAKVHCLYENESRSHSELGLMKTIERTLPVSTKSPPSKKKTSKQNKNDSMSDSDYEKKEKMVFESSEEDSPFPSSTRTLRVVPGARGSGKYWDHKSSTSSSEESEADCRKQAQVVEKKKSQAKTKSLVKSDTEKHSAKMKKTSGVPVKKKRNRNEVVMDLKDMVVQKRMASLNATAILAASYEKRSPKSNKDETTTSDSNSDKDETYAKKSKNGVATGVKCEAGIKIDECKKEAECSPPKQKVEVIVNQDTDVTITGVYSTHHEGFCTVSGLKYRISSTSHTQTTATASSEKEGCSHDEGSRYTPLSALSSMQPPPADPNAAPLDPHQHQGHEHRGLGLGRRPGCSSAFSAPPPTHAHHEPGYYQPAGPLIKETGGEAEGRTLARYHAPAHYHPHPHQHPHQHPQVLQHYGPPYYLDPCYGRYYPPRPSGYLPPSQPQQDAQMMGVAGEPYPPPPQYYTGGPCYHNTHQRVPYLEYRSCPCPMNSCPKNVHIGPATGKPPNSGGPADIPTVTVALPGGAFTAKARAARGPEPEPNITNGKDPPEEPPAAADAPHARYHPPHRPPTFSGVSPKREMCEDFRVTTDGLAAEALGPPSPARGSAGACVPQPPPAPAPLTQPPRRARLGKAMVRKTLVGEETAALMMGPQPAAQSVRMLPPAPAALITSAQDDDDVLVLSPPDVECTPIDLSSSDETEKRDSEPHDLLLADVKKENEGPDGGQTPAIRKPVLVAEAQALREHNSPYVPALESIKSDRPKPQPAKRRYSRSKLEVEPILELADGRPTNGIGEHVKLQKRRKMVPEPDSTSERNCEYEAKKKSPLKKRGTKAEPEAKICNKRKSSSGTDAPLMKRILPEPLNPPEPADARLKNPAAVCEKPKIRSAILLDKLIRKNSVDRDIGEYEPDPAELFLSPSPSVLSHNSTKRVLNINNNVVGEEVPVNDTRTAEPRLIADRILAKIALGKQSQKKLSAKAKAKLTATKLLSVPLSDKNSVKNQILGKTEPKMCTSERKTKLSNANSLSVEVLNSIPPQKETSLEPVGEKSDYDVVIPELRSPLIDFNDSNFPCPNTVILKLCEKSKLIKSKSNGAKPAEKSLKLFISKAEEIESNEKLKVSLKTDILKSKEKVSKLLESDEKSKVSLKMDNLKPKEKVSKLLESNEKPKMSLKADILKPKEKVTKLLCSKAEGKPVEHPEEAMEEVCTSGAATVSRSTGGRRRSAGGRRRLRLAGSACGASIDDLPIPRTQPRWSNGWLWEGQPFVAKVYLNNDIRQDGLRRCYSSMVHSGGDRVKRGDCVLLRAAARRGPEQPYVARVGHLWENPDDGEMMVSLVWYYRPEHTELARQPDDAPDEVFASRHRDANSVACIEDKCYVLTFNEYCRYRKRLKATEEGVQLGSSIVPPMPASEVPPGVAPADSRLPRNVSPELVLFCRKIYDFRSKKIHIPNK